MFNLIMSRFFPDCYSCSVMWVLKQWWCGSFFDYFIKSTCLVKSGTDGFTNDFALYKKWKISSCKEQKEMPNLVLKNFMINPKVGDFVAAEYPPKKRVQKGK